MCRARVMARWCTNLMLLTAVAAAVAGCARDRVRMVTIETGEDGATVAKERKVDRLPAEERAGRDSVSLADSSLLKKGAVPPGRADVSRETQTLERDSPLFQQADS